MTSSARLQRVWLVATCVLLVLYLIPYSGEFSAARGGILGSDASARTMIVSPEQCLQSAIDRAQAGDVISLTSGVWSESLVLTKSLTIRGAGDSAISGSSAIAPVITIGDGSASAQIIVRISDVRIEGLAGQTTSNSAENTCSQSGIVIQGKAVLELNSCQVSDNLGSGVIVKDEATFSAVDSSIHGNGGGRPFRSDLEDLDGVLVKDQGSATLLRTSLAGNADVGAWVRDDGTLLLEDCEIHTNFQGIEVWHRSSATVAHCRIWDNEENGVLIWDSARIGVDQSVIEANGRYGVALARTDCCSYCDSHKEGEGLAFTGCLSGGGNQITGNGVSPVCPASIGFLSSGARGTTCPPP